MAKIELWQKEEALRVLKQGGTLIFPTDTVYGIGCLPHQDEAIREIYRLKGRPKGQPLQILLEDVNRVSDFAIRIPGYAHEIMKKYWPGGITLVLPAKRGLPGYCTGPGVTVGLRIPNMLDLLDLIKRAGGSLASTSANLSGEESPLSVDQIPESIQAGVSYLIDGGALPSGSASTVLDCTMDQPKLIRAGAVPEEALEEFGLEKSSDKGAK